MQLCNHGKSEVISTSNLAPRGQSDILTHLTLQFSLSSVLTSTTLLFSSFALVDIEESPLGSSRHLVQHDRLTLRLEAPSVVLLPSCAASGVKASICKPVLCLAFCASHISCLFQPPHLLWSSEHQRRQCLHQFQYRPPRTGISLRPHGFPKFSDKV